MANIIYNICNSIDNYVSHGTYRPIRIVCVNEHLVHTYTYYVLCKHCGINKCNLKPLNEPFVAYRIMFSDQNKKKNIKVYGLENFVDYKWVITENYPFYIWYDMICPNSFKINNMFLCLCDSHKILNIKSANY